MSNWIRGITFNLLTLIVVGGMGAIAQTLTTIHDFGSRGDGENPQAGVVFDQAGNLYGTTALGGNQAGDGIVFSLTPPDGEGGPWTEAILHGFRGQPDGSSPVSSLVIFSSGRLFGTTLEGGDHNMGTVFEVKLIGNPDEPAKERVLYSFGSFAGDGIAPNAALLPAHPGFYGVTRDGGANGRGTVFQLTPPDGGGNEWTETILYSFTDSGDAAFPSSDLIMDQAGNLYGTTLLGGAANLGAVYQLSPPDSKEGGWTETVIFSFSGPDGSLPFGRLQFDQSGNLYGTTDGGGSGQAGTVFQLTPSPQPGVSWSESVLYSFSGGIDGGNPVAGVIIDNRGRLLGTASTGGSGPLSGGVIFRLDPPAHEGNPWTETVLHSFGGPDGFRPLGRLVRRENGLYSTTSAGGLNGTGTVFVLTQ